MAIGKICAFFLTKKHHSGRSIGIKRPAAQRKVPINVCSVDDFLEEIAWPKKVLRGTDCTQTVKQSHVTYYVSTFATYFFKNYVMPGWSKLY